MVISDMTGKGLTDEISLFLYHQQENKIIFFRIINISECKTVHT